MDFLSIVLIGIGLAMDAFVVCIAKGMGFKKVNLKNTINMALVFGIFQGIMTLIGYFVGGAFSKIVSTYAPIIVFLIFIVLGGKVLYETLKSEDTDEEEELEKEKLVDFKSLIALGFATSIDALAVGVSLGMMKGSSIYLSSLIIAIVTFLISLTGGILGTVMGSRVNNKYAEVFGASILIIMGFIFLFK